MEIYFEANSFAHVEEIYVKLMEVFPEIRIQPPMSVSLTSTLEGEAFLALPHSGMLPEVHKADQQIVTEIITKAGGVVSTF